jgi:hypothetical protein
MPRQLRGNLETTPAAQSGSGKAQSACPGAAHAPHRLSAPHQPATCCGEKRRNVALRKAGRGPFCPRQEPHLGRVAARRPSNPDISIRPGAYCRHLFFRAVSAARRAVHTGHEVDRITAGGVHGTSSGRRNAGIVPWTSVPWTYSHSVNTSESRVLRLRRSTKSKASRRFIIGRSGPQSAVVETGNYVSRRRSRRSASRAQSGRCQRSALLRSVCRV